MDLLKRIFPGKDGKMDEIRKNTDQAQASASDPASSAWVSANAGTGKTHVLTMRVLRLLLAGTPPERILALTYTKAAAAEMSKRVFAELAKWVTASDKELAAALEKLSAAVPSADDMRLARRLFAIAIETPGGLKVQTIHAFCERLLQRFSLEAGVPPGFAILDDQEKAELLREAVDKVLTEATAPGAKDTPLAQALKTAVAFAAEQSFEQLLSEALRQRDWLDLAGDNDETDFARAEGVCRSAFGVAADTSLAEIEAAIQAVMPREEMQRAKDVLEGGSKNDQAAAERIAKALRAQGPHSRIPALCDVFLTQKLEPRKALMTKALCDEFPEVLLRLEQAQQRIFDLMEQRARLQVYEASVALLRIAGRVMGHYRNAKARRAALDFEDLVARAASLLGTSEAVEWVLFKLDGGLDHILVDEAQDTSPLQWQVVKALAQEFFAGHGAHEGARTIFAVGDEKQSIYGFQGAAPGMFREMKADFKQQALSVGATWQTVSLGLSFRTVAPLLSAVDKIFADAGRTPGVGTNIEPHVASRTGHGGRVEIWPLEMPDDDKDNSLPWQPHAAPSSKRPAQRLAARIADTIAGWLATEEKLVSENRPIRAGDILILVRKRAPFAPMMVSALKARRIPVAGADRLLLTEQIAVMDLMALGQVMVLPEDDLALAGVLKSPLFGLDDDDLLALAPDRLGSLWQALHDKSGTTARYAAVVHTLRRWQELSARLAPYEFFAALLDAEGGRTKMLARLGPDAADPIDEFLNLALAHGEHAPPTLQGFLTSLSQGRHEIKRDMEQGRDEVRVMTVHGSKGLEAPIVFLPDTCHSSSGRSPGTLLKLADPASGDGPVPFLWPVKGASAVPAVDTARRAEGEREQEERNRLLYVALTRPRDRLYVAGFQQSKNEPAKDSWYRLIEQAVADIAVPQEQSDGRTLLVIESRQTAKPKAKARHEASQRTSEPLPPWLGRPAPAEPVLTVPLSPSRLAPLEMEAGDASKPLRQSSASKRPREPAILPPAILADEARFLRGTLTHALLEHLPTLPPATQEPAALAFLAAQAPKLSRATRAGIVKETITILRDPTFAPLFGPNSRAEVALSAEIPRPDGQPGPALRLAGKIDRLVQQGNSVLIVDYKTNRPPPDDPSRVADAYLLQLAAYRLAVQGIFPDCSIRCAILWTDGPRIMEMRSELLDTYQGRLWGLDTGVLDA